MPDQLPGDAPPPPPPERPPVQLSPPPSNLCVCFHVPLHKVVKYIRLNNPRVPSQLSECYGAGTGCGWCIPFLEKIFEQMRQDPSSEPEIGLTEAEYLARRREYHQKINAQKMRDVRDNDPT